MLRYLLEDVAAARVFGCDIDREAIDWVRANVKGPSFETIPTSPPTLYPDSHFDLIYGI